MTPSFSRRLAGAVPTISQHGLDDELIVCKLSRCMRLGTSVALNQEDGYAFQLRAIPHARRTMLVARARRYAQIWADKIKR